MSQVCVERIIGLLATDESFRRHFMTNPRAALMEMVERRMELTPCELMALTSLDPHELARFAQSIDPRLQKADLDGGAR